MTHDFSTNGLLYPLTKGAVVGHPFEGNQWTDKAQSISDDKDSMPNFNAKQAGEFERQHDIMLSHHKSAEVAARVRGDKVGEALHRKAFLEHFISSGGAGERKTTPAEKVTHFTPRKAAKATWEAEKYDHENGIPDAGAGGVGAYRSKKY